MALMHIPLERIDESHLRQLIDAQAAETLYIDYKRETYGANDDARAEFLADTSSFANTAGGDMVIGMAETQGVPTGLIPLTMDADGERQRLENMALTGLEPRIPALQTKAVRLADGGFALVVRVPRTYNPPHRVIFKGKNRFWARTSVRKYEPNVEELRHMFTGGHQLAERIRAFRMERIARVASGETVVSLHDGPLLVLHVVPYSAFNLRQSLLLAEVEQKGQLFPPLRRDRPTHWHVNFDGFITLSNGDDAAIRHHSYAHVFHSGIVEAVTTGLANSQKLITTGFIEATIVKYARLYASSLHTCGVEPPMAILATILGVEGLSFVTGQAQERFQDPTPPINRNQLHLVGAVLETLPVNDQECGLVLRPILDHLANAAGAAASPSFDANGLYVMRFQP